MKFIGILNDLNISLIVRGDVLRRRLSSGQGFHLSENADYICQAARAPSSVASMIRLGFRASPMTA